MLRVQAIRCGKDFRFRALRPGSLRLILGLRVRGGFAA